MENSNTGSQGKASKHATSSTTPQPMTALEKAAHHGHVAGSEYGLWVCENLCLDPECSLEAQEIQDAYSFDMVMQGPRPPLSLGQLPFYLQAAFSITSAEAAKIDPDSSLVKGIDPETAIVKGVRYKRLPKCELVHSVRSLMIYTKQHSLEARAHALVHYLHQPDRLHAWLEMYFEVGEQDKVATGLTSLYELYYTAFERWKESTHVYSVRSFLSGIREVFKKAIRIVQVTKQHFVIHGLDIRSKPQHPRDLIRAKHKLGFQRAVKAGIVEDRPPMNEFQRHSQEHFYVPPVRPTTVRRQNLYHRQVAEATGYSPVQGKRAEIRLLGQRKRTGHKRTSEMQKAFEQAKQSHDANQDLRVRPEPIRKGMSEKKAGKQPQVPPPPVPANSPLRSQQAVAFSDVPGNAPGDVPGDVPGDDTEADTDLEDEGDAFNMDEMRRILDEIE